MTFKDFITKFGYDTLDKQQRAAVQATKGPVLLLAVPGSGKTTTLLARLGYLIYGKGVDPSKILTCTYTVAATNEMRTRFRAKFGDEYADQLEFRTINGVCARIINMYEQEGHKAFQLITDDSKRFAIMREAWMADNHGFPADSDLRGMSTAITYVKNQMLSDQEANSVEFSSSEGACSIGPVYRAYKKEMRSRHWMDFDDQMVYALCILKKCPTILNNLQKKYTYFCVDEAQDTSKIQHEVLALLASKTKNILMVGDEDQSIYGFRAAYPKALMDFEQNWPGAKVLLMEQNYRSTPQIVNVADKFIRQNKNRHAKHMNAFQNSGSEISFKYCASRNKQYEILADMCRKANEENIQTAILYRNNDTALPVIDMLTREGIPYQAKGVDGLFFTSKIVNDVKDFLILALHPDDKERFLHLYYKLGIFMKKAVANLSIGGNGENVFEAYASLDNKDLVSDYLADCLLEKNFMLKVICNDGNPVTAISHMKSMGYWRYLQDAGIDTFRLDILIALAYREETIEGFLDRLDVLQQIVKRGGHDMDASCILSTIHSSKGLEYQRVILADVVKNVLPSDTSKIKNPIDKENAEEEERRLFYVGVTRAKKELIVMNVNNAASSYVDILRQLVPDKKKTSQKAAPSQKHPTKTSTSKADTGATKKKTKCSKSKGSDLSEYEVGSIVYHRSFGDGIILSRKNDFAVIDFHDNGKRTLALPFAIDMGFLKLA